MEWRMKMDDILKLISIDYSVEVGEIIDQVPIGSEYYQKLKKQMIKDMDNRVPILVEKDRYGEGMDYLGNGHHRVRIAYENGWDSMLATDDDQHSGYGARLSGQIIED